MPATPASAARARARGPTATCRWRPRVAAPRVTAPLVAVSPAAAPCARRRGLAAVGSWSAAGAPPGDPARSRPGGRLGQLLPDRVQGRPDDLDRVRVGTPQEPLT